MCTDNAITMTPCWGWWHLQLPASWLFAQRFVQAQIKQKTSKLRVTGLYAGNSPMTGEFPAQRASNAELFPFDDVIMGEPVSVISLLAEIDSTAPLLKYDAYLYLVWLALWKFWCWMTTDKQLYHIWVDITLHNWFGEGDRHGCIANDDGLQRGELSQNINIKHVYEQYLGGKTISATIRRCIVHMRQFALNYTAITILYSAWMNYTQRMNILLN